MLYPVECPYCGLTFENNAEYVDVGWGGGPDRGIQVTGNVCDRCGASEQGALRDHGGPELAFGWYPPAGHYIGEGLEWLDEVIARVFAEGVKYGHRHRTGAPHDSLAPTFAPPLATADVPF